LNIEYRTRNKEFRSLSNNVDVLAHNYSTNFDIPCSLFDIRYSHSSLFDIRYSFWLSLMILFFLFSSCTSTKNETLNIATAANMQFTMEALVEAFEEESKIDCEIILSSSGKLTAQIKEGAPYDVLVSANMKFPNSLFDQGLTYDKSAIYAFGKLVLWSTMENFKPSLQKLTDPTIKHIALANPKTAPYGEAAIELLQKLNLFEKVKDKLVYGENISQTNQFITSQAAEVGFTAKSVILSPRLKGKGTWIEIDDNLHQPIAQGIVILKNRPSQIEKAKQFHTFIFSKKGKNILKEYGYAVN